MLTMVTEEARQGGLSKRAQLGILGAVVVGFLIADTAGVFDGGDAQAGDIHNPDGTLNPDLSALDTQADLLNAKLTVMHEHIWRLRDALDNASIPHTHPLYLETERMLDEYVRLVNGGLGSFTDVTSQLSIAESFDSRFFNLNSGNAQTVLNQAQAEIHALEARIQVVHGQLERTGIPVPEHHKYPTVPSRGLRLRAMSVD